jgi:DNA-binding beta-propeller fold protein YncE
MAEREKEMRRIYFYITCLLVFFVFFSCTASKKMTEETPVKKLTKQSIFIPVVSGDIETVFEGVFGEASEIKSPRGIAIGIDGSLYVCSRDRSSILRFDKDGKLISRFNGFDSRTAQVFLPFDITGTEVYALDNADSRIIRFDRNLKNAYVFFKPEADNSNLFGMFGGIAADKETGDLYLTDINNKSIVKIDMLTKKPRYTGSFGSEKISFREPAGLDVAPDGTIYIADRGLPGIGIMKYFGARVNFIGEGFMEAPNDVAVVSDSLLAVADKNGVLLLDTAGKARAALGYGIDREISPVSVAFSAGMIFISDVMSSSILVYRIKI